MHQSARAHEIRWPTAVDFAGMAAHIAGYDVGIRFQLQI